MVSPRCCQGYRSVSTTVMGCCHGNPSCYCEDCGGIFPRKGITCNMCSPHPKTCALAITRLLSRGSQNGENERSKSKCMQNKDVHCCSHVPPLLELLYQKKNKKPQGSSVSKLLNTHTRERHG